MGISITGNLEKKPYILDEKKAKEILLHLASNNYRWVDYYDEENTLEEIFEAWRYETERTDKGLLVCEHTGENLGEDDKLWWNIKSVISDMELHLIREDGFTDIIKVENNQYYQDTD